MSRVSVSQQDARTAVIADPGVATAFGIFPDGARSEAKTHLGRFETLRRDPLRSGDLGSIFGMQHMRCQSMLPRISSSRWKLSPRAP
jgi:hypothetical protein